MIRLLRRRSLSCDEIMEVLQGYLDGEVDAKTARRVAAHLDACDGCATETDVYRRLKDSLAHVPTETVDPEIMDRLQDFSRRVIDGEMS
ncbi:MAG: anti-sigma factor family protein [Acidimicrobiales bacterium]